VSSDDDNHKQNLHSVRSLDPRSWSNTKPDFNAEEVYRKEKKVKKVKTPNSDMYEDAG